VPPTLLIYSLEKQHHRCADCNRVLNVVDWHHRNGDRSDNRVEFLSFLKIGFKFPYRMVQGIVCGLAEYVKIVEEIHFTHIRKRMIKINPSIGNDNDTEEPITLAEQEVLADAAALPLRAVGQMVSLETVIPVRTAQTAELDRTDHNALAVVVVVAALIDRDAHYFLQPRLAVVMMVHPGLQSNR
jgi:hypothetical protein